MSLLDDAIKRLTAFSVAGGIVLAASTDVAAAQSDQSGEISRSWPALEALCVHLSETRSRYVSRICFKEVSVRWRVSGFGGSPLVNTSVRWDRHPAIWLHGDETNAAGRPLGTFSEAVQSAFEGVSLTGLDLAAAVLPSGGNAQGVGLLLHPGILPGAGGDYDGNMPSSFNWDSFLVDMPEGNACAYSRKEDGTPVHLPGDIGQAILADGFHLNNLHVCGASFAGLVGLNTALQRSCEASASESENQACRQGKPDAKTVEAETPDEEGGASLDDLLQGLDEPPDTQTDAAQVAAVDGSADLDELLAGLDGDPPPSQDGSQSATPAAKAGDLDSLLADAESGYEALLQRREEEAMLQAALDAENLCQSRAEQFDNTVANFVEWLGENMGSSFSFDVDPNYGGSCGNMIEEMTEEIEWKSRDPGLHYFPGNPGRGAIGRYADQLAACRDARQERLNAFREEIAQIDFSECSFGDGGDPKDQIAGIVEAVEDENDNLDDQVRHAHEIDRAFIAAGDQSASQMSASFYRDMTSNLSRFDLDLDDLVTRRSDAFTKYREWQTKRSVTMRSTTTTTATARPRGQTNPPLVIENGVLCNMTDPAARQACLQRNRPQPQADMGGAKSGKCGYETCAKTQ